MPARDTVEVLTFLTAAARVRVTIGGTVTTYAAPAGLSAKLFPLAVGTHAVDILRGDTVTARTTSRVPVRRSVKVQDLNYYVSTSGRR